jgi:putative ABC transport system permease protein
MPPRLSPPYAQVQILAPRVFEVGGLTPLQIENGASYAQPIARLKPGVSLEQARAELASISRNYREKFGGKLDAVNTTEAQMFVTSLVGNLEPTFYTLLAAVAFVLLIACANVASLCLARLVTRHKELAVRQAIGATRGRVRRQFLIESLVFSLIAGGLGTVLGFFVLSAIEKFLGPQLPPNTQLTLNARALLFTIAISIATAMLVGLAPAIHASRTNVGDALKDYIRGSTGERAGRMRAILIVGEVALSVVLLVGSTLLLISFLKLQSTSPGFEPKGAAAAFVGISTNRLKTPGQQAEFFNPVIERLRSQPHVTAAAASVGLPLSGFSPRSPYSVEGRPVLPLPQRPLAGLSIVSEDYFSLMRITLLEGRVFTTDDREGAPGVCIINESLAKRLFPGESALGKVLLRGRDAELKSEIVGVIRDVKTLGVNAPTPDEIYHPMRQLGRPNMALVARTDGDPAMLQTALRAAVAEVDKNQPISFFSTLENSVAQSLGTQRTVATFTSVFAGLAVALAAVGLYSALAYAVSRRTPEIGIRVALGAKPSEVIVLVLRSGLRLVFAGLGIGIVAAAFAARLIQTLLFNVQPVDPIVYGGVVVLFTLVAALACLVPSLRASRIDPLVALRSD